MHEHSSAQALHCGVVERARAEAVRAGLGAELHPKRFARAGR